MAEIEEHGPEQDPGASGLEAEPSAGQSAVEPEVLSDDEAGPDDASIAAIEQSLEEAESAEEPEPTSEVEPVSEAAEEVEVAVEQAAVETAPVAEVSDEDLSAAIAAAGESVGAETEAPAEAVVAEGETVAAEEVAAEGAEAPAAEAAQAAPEIVPETQPEEFVVPVARYGAPWWPYLVYLALWVVVAGLSVWQLQQLPAGAVAYESQTYRLVLFAGLAMAVVGALLGFVVWLASRDSEKRHRKGLLISALFKGASFTLLGVVVWWGTLMAVDYLRFGRLF